MATGRVRGVAIGEGKINREICPCQLKVAASEGWPLVRGAVYRGTTVSSMTRKC